MRVGFIGLGSMGAHRAANLAAAGQEVTGYDPLATLVDRQMYGS